MPRRSLRPELNRIRAWVRQGRTDAWIAHQLEVTVQQIQAFKREQALEPDADPDAPAAATDFDDEIDLRAEDDALIAAELDAEAAAAEEAAAAAAAEEAARAAAQAQAATEEDDDEKPKRRRSRGGGPPTPRGPPQAQGRHAARGHLRSRGGGLRPVARPRRPGRPGLCRVLGRTPAGRGDDRGGPDRHPSRRR
jgi:hypothetical protein